MGPVRHRHLIRLLSFVVALNMVVGLAALWARSGDAGGSEAAARISAPETQSGSILAGGRFTERRGSKDRPERPATTAPAAAVPPAAAPADQTTTTGPSPESSTSTVPAPRPSTSVAPAPAPAAPTTTTRPAPATTATTGAPIPAPGPEAAAAGEAARPGTLTDPTGDTFVDGSNGPISEARADIVRVGSEYAADAITFVLQVDRPSNPRDDERWASDSTYVGWEVDTNGDGTPDFDVQYYLLDAENLGGSVTRAGDGGEAVCDVTVVSYNADGYKISIAPACLGNPASFSYRASIFYDTNPADEEADVASDVTPDGGMSFPVKRP